MWSFKLELIRQIKGSLALVGWSKCRDVMVLGEDREGIQNVVGLRPMVLYCNPPNYNKSTSGKMSLAGMYLNY